MRRNRAILVALLGLVVVLLIASQIALPAIAASQAEKRLTENGGEASAKVSAFPALRLLFGDGDRIEAEASGLDLELEERQKVLERLDGFGEVDVRIDDSTVGPIEISSFRLVRKA